MGVLRAAIMTDETEEILDFYRKYTADFSGSLLALPRYYHYPSMMITPERVIRFRHGVDLVVKFSLAMIGLRARGYHHSDLPSLRAEMLGSSLALVSGVAVRYAKGDREIERFGLRYMVRKVEGRWGIVLAGITEAPEIDEANGARAVPRRDGRVAEVQARDLLTVLRARGIGVPEAVSKRIQGLNDADRFERWLQKAAVASTLTEVLDEPS